MLLQQAANKKKKTPTPSVFFRTLQLFSQLSAGYNVWERLCGCHCLSVSGNQSHTRQGPLLRADQPNQERHRWVLGFHHSTGCSLLFCVLNPLLVSQCQLKPSFPPQNKNQHHTHPFVDMVDLCPMSGQEKSGCLTACASCSLHETVPYRK